ncbi:hypothetical protein GCM10023339_46730 [Alloalcanivorax gelatiniphagus]
MPNLITKDNLGAWLIKCDPDSKFDLPRQIEEQGTDVVTNWSVFNSYRSRMMQPGDKAILWVSGNGRRMTRGIWGVGWITGYVQDTVAEVLEPGEDSYWHSEKERLAVTNDVALYIPLFEVGTELAAADLVAAGINALEVQTQAQMSNPSWVTKEQLAEIEALLEPWPEYVDPDEEITVSNHGAGFGDSHHNLAVEEAAMAAVIEYYRGWKFEDVSADKVGWDITFTEKATREVARVEVKGVSGDRPVVLLTANEIRAAEEENDWYLAVVTRALSNPEVIEYTAEQALEAAVPYVYKAHMPNT